MTQEEKLMRKISQGDREAAEQLVQLLYPELLRYCLRHVPRREEAEDAVQETFLKASAIMTAMSTGAAAGPFSTALPPTPASTSSGAPPLRLQASRRWTSCRRNAPRWSGRRRTGASASVSDC